MPFFEGRPVLSCRDGRQDFPELIDPVRRQLDGEVVCVDDPSQDHFESAPRAIALQEFLDGYGLASLRRIARVQRVEDIVNRVEEGTANSLAVCEAVGAWGILWV